MKRRLGLLLASTVLATVGMFGVSPVEAHTTACAGTGTATLSAGFGLPPNWRSANFSASLTVGACGDGSSLSATGFVNGACGSSSGYGTTNTGHNFAFVSEAGTLYVTGSVTGQFSVVEDPLDAGSCLTNSATRFTLNGSVALSHPNCTITGRVDTTAPYVIWTCTV